MSAGQALVKFMEQKGKKRKEFEKGSEGKRVG